MTEDNKLVRGRLYELKDGDVVSVYNEGESEIFKYENNLLYRVEEYVELIEDAPMTRYKSVGEGYHPLYINKIVK